LQVQFSSSAKNLPNIFARTLLARHQRIDRITNPRRAFRKTLLSRALANLPSNRDFSDLTRVALEPVTTRRSARRASRPRAQSRFARRATQHNRCASITAVVRSSIRRSHRVRRACGVILVQSSARGQRVVAVRIIVPQDTLQGPPMRDQSGLRALP
jgi:hypothetical protein